MNNSITDVISIDISGAIRTPHPEGAYRAICTGVEYTQVQKDGPNKGALMLKTKWTTSAGDAYFTCAIAALETSKGPMPPYSFANMLREVFATNSREEAISLAQSFVPASLLDREVIIHVEHSGENAQIVKFERVA